MKNVFDIKREKSLNYIIPLEKNYVDDNQKKNVLMIIHLHYYETLDYFFHYIKNIPQYIDICFTVSDEKVKKDIEQREIYRRSNCRIIEKENRGRDISAFLVACREYIKQYDYIGFVHDKKTNKPEWEKDTLLWIENLWGNMLGSSGYIENLLHVFENNAELGLLVPPSPISDLFSTGFTNSWGKNFNKTKELAQKMQLICDLNYEKWPLTLGTVFWAKKDALKKLLDIEWKYEDFDEEPLNIDGTISHAIERILAYVAQDAGYITGWVMNTDYASKRIEYMNCALEKVFEHTEIYTGVDCIAELAVYDDEVKELMEFSKKYESIYIYGAGVYGRKCLKLLVNGKTVPKGFLVSSLTSEETNIDGIPIYTLGDITLNKTCGIVIATSETYHEEILDMIKRYDENFENVYLFKLKY